MKKTLLKLWNAYWNIHEPAKTIEERLPWLADLEKARAKRGVCAPTVEKEHEQL
jgi:hypothetical protein